MLIKNILKAYEPEAEATQITICTELVVKWRHKKTAADLIF